MNEYPASLVPPHPVQPVPRRIRAVLAGRTILDTERALYVLEWSHYPQYYIPLADVQPDVLVNEGHHQHGALGTFEVRRPAGRR